MTVVQNDLVLSDESMAIIPYRLHLGIIKNAICTLSHKVKTVIVNLGSVNIKGA